jgi:hypothetical protein
MTSEALKHVNGGGDARSRTLDERAKSGPAHW